MRIAAFRNILNIDHKIIYGFDIFGKFPKQQIVEDIIIKILKKVELEYQKRFK